MSTKKAPPSMVTHILHQSSIIEFKSIKMCYPFLHVANMSLWWIAYFPKLAHVTSVSTSLDQTILTKKIIDIWWRIRKKQNNWCTKILCTYVEIFYTQAKKCIFHLIACVKKTSFSPKIVNCHLPFSQRHHINRKDSWHEVQDHNEPTVNN